MSEEMPSSWRSIASAASRSIKGYIAQQRELKPGYPASRDSLPPGTDQFSKKQSWSQWAGQKLRRGNQGEYDFSGDKLALFPGWATRRYRQSPKGAEEDTPFDVDVFISGYAYKLTGVGFNTRAGKAFLRLAKSFAALPKLPVQSGPALSRSTEDLLAGTNLPPLPNEITDESELQAIDEKLRHLEFDERSDSLSETSSEYPDSRTPFSTSAASSYTGNGGPRLPEARTPPTVLGSASDLSRWHANLEARLHPFWSSVLSNRTVRVSLYAADPSLFEPEDGRTTESASSENSDSPEKQPIISRSVTTAVDGSFQLKLSIPWESMCVHPGALHIAFGGPDLEQDLFVTAELLAPPSPTTTPAAEQYQPRIPRTPTVVTVVSSIAIPLTHSSIRVISDIDDTVKLSGILSGARAVFQNVFVKDLRESVIRGMGDWYTEMWRRGLRFHYVSNGPFELLPVVNEFLQISQLPPGSIRLRSYGGRSLFNGLLSAPAMRKRTAVLDVLNHFPEARFFLVGDSGEQDLELYAEIARERPNQILAIFIRDASVRGDNAARPLDDPTAAEAFRMSMEGKFGTPGSSPGTGGRLVGLTRRSGRSTPSRAQSMLETPQTPSTAVPKKPLRTYSDTNVLGLSSSASSGESSDYFNSVLPTHSPITEEPQESPEMMAPGGRQWPPRGFSKGPPSSGLQTEFKENGRWQPQPQPQPSLQSQSSSQSSLPDSEKKRIDLQMRLWRARFEVAPHIPLRVFREPEECVEVNQLLDRLQVRKR